MHQWRGGCWCTRSTSSSCLVMRDSPRPGRPHTTGDTTPSITILIDHPSYRPGCTSSNLCLISHKCLIRAPNAFLFWFIIYQRLFTERSSFPSWLVSQISCAWSQYYSPKGPPSKRDNNVLTSISAVKIHVSSCMGIRFSFVLTHFFRNFRWRLKVR